MDILNELNTFLSEEPIGGARTQDNNSITSITNKLLKLMSEEESADYLYTDTIKQIDRLFNSEKIPQMIWSEVVKVLEHIREEERTHKYQLKKLINKLDRRQK